MASDQTTPPIDPPPEYLRQGRTDEPQPEVVSDPGRMRRIGLVALAAAIVAASATGMWLAYEQGVRKGVQMAPPLIRADKSPVKVAPEEPGGMEVPHQDKTVYDRLSGKPETVEAERLLPPPEVIVKKPEPVQEPEDKPEPVEKVAEKADTVANEVPLVKAGAPAKPEEPKPEKEVAVAPKPEPKPAPAPKPAPPPPAKPEPKPAAKPAPAPSPSGYLIQVGAYRTADKARTGWARLVKGNKALLGALSPVIVEADLGNRGVFHRLRAGPVDGAEAASALCNRLKQRKVGCLVIKP